MLPLASMTGWLGRLSATVSRELTSLAARAWSLVQAWSGGKTLETVRSSLATMSPFACARYGVVFFAGVGVTLVWHAWQSGGTDVRPVSQPVVALAASPADVEQLRQTIDRLAAEVTKIRTVQQGILEKVSAVSPSPSPSPAAPAAARSTAQQRSPGR